MTAPERFEGRLTTDVRVTASLGCDSCSSRLENSLQVAVELVKLCKGEEIAVRLSAVQLMLAEDATERG